mgnify:FL=1
MVEILPIVNERDEVIDEIDKSIFDKKTGRIYRVVSLILFNENDEFLIQRRAFSKKTFAGKWQFSASAGHVQIGESYLDAIYRETIEEIGLNLKPRDFIEVGKVFIHTKENKRRFMQFFTAKVDFNLEDLAILHNEVAEVKLVNLAEFKEMIRENPDDFMDSLEFSLRIIKDAQEKIKNNYSQAIL